MDASAEMWVVLVMACGVSLGGLTAVAWLRRDRARLRRMVADQAHELSELRSRMLPAMVASPLGDALATRPPTAATWAMRAVFETATRVRERGLVHGLLMAPMEDFARWALEDSEGIEAMADDEGDLTVLFSDIENSTQLNEALGDLEWVSVLEAHDLVVQQIVAAHHGRIVKSQGDGFMVAFSSPDDALAAALKIQASVNSPKRARLGRRARANRTLRRQPLRVRIGIHTGTVVTREDDYFGRNVAKAARVAALAAGSQVVLSDETWNALQRTSARVKESVHDFGAHELKGLQGTHHLWVVQTTRLRQDGHDDR